MGYLVGVYAALLETKSDLTGLNEQKILGFVGGEDSPVICDFLVGYIEGAQSIDPDIKVDWRWIGNYTDSALGKEIGAAEIEAGADIIWGVGGNAGTGAVEACYEKGMYFIGVDSDQKYINDAVIICSMKKEVGKSIYDAISRIVGGDVSQLGTTWVADMSNGYVGIGYGEEGATQQVTDEIKAAVEELREKIVSGEIKVDTTR
jgi:basic membrane protein A